MMVMTAKLNFKKILMLLGTAAAVILALILLLGGNTQNAVKTDAPSLESNASRVKFLNDLGWQVKDQPVESGKVKIPKETSSVFERYNNLQKSQGYDLTRFAGKKVMRYVYQVENAGQTTAPIYATMLILGGKIIGGDITDTGAGGRICGFKQKTMPKPAALPQKTSPAETQPEVQPPAPSEIAH